MRQITDRHYEKMIQLADACRALKAFRESLHAAHDRSLAQSGTGPEQVREALDSPETRAVMVAVEEYDAAAAAGVADPVVYRDRMGSPAGAPSSAAEMQHADLSREE